MNRLFIFFVMMFFWHTALMIAATMREALGWALIFQIAAFVHILFSLVAWEPNK